MRGGSPRLYLMNADGTNEAPLAIGGPAFAATQHDGKRIAFSGDTEDGDTEIYTVEVATGAVLRLTYRATGGPIQPAYSPDGTRVAFSDFRNISTVLADGSGAESNVTTGQNHDHYAPAYSPDGARLSYYKFEYILDAGGERIGELRGVFVSDVNGGNVVDTQTPSSVSSAWRPVVNDPDPEQPTPAERVNSLISLVRGFNLPFGTTNSLIVKLRAALDAIEAGDNATACARLADFINHAEAQSGKKLSAAQAAQITTEAASIRAALGCQ
jgi:Tol biopolymer transport system component